MQKLLLFHWALVFPPGLVFLFVWLSYRRILTYKRIQIESRMAAGDISRSYTSAFGSEAQDPRETIQRLFNIHYSLSTYVVPIFMNVLLATIASVFALVYSGLDMNIPSEVASLIRRIPASVLAACAGAYVWGLYDIFHRYQTMDLSPVSLHLVWWRFLLAPILTPLITVAFSPSLQSLIGFLIGAFPASTLLDFAKSVARGRINIDAPTELAERPNLHNLQGMTKEMIDRLAEEGFQSTEHLAQADPIRLLLRTNIEWKVILDIIDQAILFNYLGDKTATLRDIGFRGAIEVAAIVDDLEDEQTKPRAEKTIALMASRLGQEEVGVRNLMHTLYDDVQVDFIWALWGEAALGTKDDEQSAASQPAQA